MNLLTDGLAQVLELRVSNWKYNLFWGFCPYILSCDSYLVQSSTKAKTNLHIAAIKKLKSFMVHSVTGNGVFSYSEYEN